MTAAILDVDGTLVDTNYQHALAWFRAFRGNGVLLPLWRIHRHIGMGGDQLVPALAGEEVECERGDQIREAESELYGEMIGEVEPVAGARELIEDLRRQSRGVVLASSARGPEVERYIEMLDARELADAWTTYHRDVQRSKPEPDLIRAALERGGGEAHDALMVGDSTWDFHAAQRVGVRAVGVMTRGFSREELLDAGAVDVYESVAELRSSLKETVLRGKPSRS